MIRIIDQWHWSDHRWCFQSDVLVLLCTKQSDKKNKFKYYTFCESSSSHTFWLLYKSLSARFTANTLRCLSRKFIWCFSAIFCRFCRLTALTADAAKRFLSCSDSCPKPLLPAFTSIGTGSDLPSPNGYR